MSNEPRMVFEDGEFRIVAVGSSLHVEQAHGRDVYGVVRWMPDLCVGAPGQRGDSDERVSVPRSVFRTLCAAVERERKNEGEIRGYRLEIHRLQSECHHGPVEPCDRCAWTEAPPPASPKEDPK